MRLLLGVAFMLLLVWLLDRELLPKTAPALCEALAKGRIVRVYTVGEAGLRCPGVRVERADEQLTEVLRSPPETPLTAGLRSQKGVAVALPVELDASFAGRLGERLARRAHVPGLRAVALSRELALYAPAHEVELTSPEREALGYVARALLRGAREPSVASFPAALRRVERVEVMVMLSRRGEPRLWRSARATSIARALLTATRVARDRWREREQAMGGPLAQKLLELDVEVVLLSEDGTLLNAQSPFVDGSVFAEHGIGFDYRTSWHYVLPRDVQRQGGPSKALAMQLKEQGLTLASLESDARVYRFVPVQLGLSKAPLEETSN